MDGCGLCIIRIPYPVFSDVRILTDRKNITKYLVSLNCIGGCVETCTYE